MWLKDKGKKKHFWEYQMDNFLIKKKKIEELLYEDFAKQWIFIFEVKETYNLTPRLECITLFNIGVLY